MNAKTSVTRLTLLQRILSPLRATVEYMHRFFFQEVSASGFGLMRIGWAFVVLILLLGSAGDVVRYYSELGLVPDELSSYVFRGTYRFSLLMHITDPASVIGLWVIFVLCLLCMMVGIWPRLMTIICVLLLFSFHERNLQPLGGGDTVLRNIGFILMIAPEVSAYSLSRAKLQWTHWKRTGTLLPTLKTHIWPYRLLLWQLIIIYLTSLWDKLQGTMWLDGTVVEAVFHHTHFFRYSREWQDALVWMSPFASFYTLILEALWIFMLVPKEVWHVLPECIRRHSFKRWLIVLALLFHWGIFVFMDVGAFPFAMSVAFTGLLLDRDFAVLKRIANRRWHGKIIVLFDGACGLCRRSVFWLSMLDWLGRVEIVDFRNASKRKKHAPGIREADLDRAMHIKIPDGRYFKGFDAFRVLSWHFPATKLLTPTFFLPGVPPIGRMIYQKIADRRDKCAHGACKIG